MCTNHGACSTNERYLNGIRISLEYSRQRKTHEGTGEREREKFVSKTLNRCSEEFDFNFSSNRDFLYDLSETMSWFSVCKYQCFFLSFPFRWCSCYSKDFFIICLCTDIRQGTQDFVLSECCGICMRWHKAVVREEERNVKVQNRYICHWFRTYGILYSMLGISLMKTLPIRGYRFFVMSVNHRIVRDFCKKTLA